MAITTVERQQYSWYISSPVAALGLPQVGFKDQKLIRRLKVETRLNAVVNRLNSTKREENPDLAAEREAYDKEASPTI